MRFNNLPTEIQFDIFSKFSAKDLCTIIAPVNRRWRRFAYESALWTNVPVTSALQPHLTTRILQQCPKIRNLIFVNVENFSWLFNLPKREALREVSFDYCALSPEIISQFLVVFPHVQKYGIHPPTPSANVYFKLLTAWEYLTEIDFRSVSYGNTTFLDEIVKDCENLTSLRMGLRQTERSFVDFLKLRGAQLRRLDLNDMDDINDNVYLLLSQCRQLRYLSLASPKKLTDQNLVKFSELKELERFTLTNNKNIFSADFPILSETSNFPANQIIQLTYCTNLNAVSLTSFIRCCAFNDLVVSITSNLTEDDCKSVANENQ